MDNKILTDFRYRFSNKGFSKEYERLCVYKLLYLSKDTIYSLAHGIKSRFSTKSTQYSPQSL